MEKVHFCPAKVVRRRYRGAIRCEADGGVRLKLSLLGLEGSEMRPEVAEEIKSSNVRPHLA
jgi:hypothetical protein